MSMKKLVFVAFMLLGGCVCLQSRANEGKWMEKIQMIDTTVQKTMKVEIKSVEDLQNLFKMITGGGGDAGGVRVGMTRMIETPVVRESSVPALRVQAVTLTDSVTLITLDIQNCKGKLTGVDTSAYIQVDGKQYSIKEMKGGKLPQQSNAALKVDAKKTSIDLIFPGISVITARELDLILSKAPNGIQIKGISLLKKVSTAQ